MAAKKTPKNTASKKDPVIELQYITAVSYTHLTLPTKA